MSRSFVYVGKGDESPGEVTVRGLTFKRGGDPVEVPNPGLAGNLAGNPEFQEEGAAATPDVASGDMSGQLAADNMNLRLQLDQANARIQELEAELSKRDEDYPAPTPAEDVETVFSEIQAAEDWSREHHSTRIRWANALCEGDVRTADEANEVILNALIEREADAGDDQ